LMYRFMKSIYYLMREQVGVSYDHIIAKGDTLIDVIYSVHNATLKALENKDSKTAVMLTAKGYEDVFPDLDFSKIRNYE